MRREFIEEAGLSLFQWIPFCELNGKDWTVYCFKVFNTAFYKYCFSRTDETIVKIKVKDIKKAKCMSNLPWLIEMALDFNDGKPFYAKVNYDTNYEPI